MSLTIYFDYDGVIQDTGKIITEQYNLASKGNDFDVWDFFSHINWHYILEKSPLIDYSIETVKELSISENVSILTCFSSYEEAREKCIFCNHLLTGIPIVLCPYKIPKSIVVPSQGTILIDDRSRNIIDWNTHDGIGILYGKEKAGLKSVQNMKELIKLIDGMM